jgi:ABC-2 type transport system ATP-binding protein
LHQPKILFLDEPTVGVDPQSRNKIFEFVQELNKQGITILYTTHYMEEAQKLCHRVLIIDKGKKIACDSPDNLIKLLGGGIVEIRQKEVQLIGLEQLKKIPEIKSIQPRKENFKIEVENLENVLPQIVSLFLKHKIPLHFLKIWEPNLESVFLHLPGKELRE